MIRKSKELKVIVTNRKRLIFVHMKDELFVCHTDMNQWVRCVGAEGGKDNGPKIEAVDSDNSDEE